MTTRVFKMPTAIASPGVLPRIAVSTPEKQIGALRLAGGLRAWWQADVGFMDGAAIEWIDRIGSKRLLAAQLPGMAASVPVKQEAAIKGAAAISFSTASLIDPAGQNFFPLNADFSFVVVCRFVPTDGAVVVCNHAPWATATYLVRHNTNRFSWAMNGYSVSGAEGSAPSDVVHVVVCGYTAATKTLTLRQNGTLVQSMARAQHINQDSRLRVGAHVGPDNAVTFSVDAGGLIPLVMAFGSDITADARAADLAVVEGWLIDRYR